MATYTYQPHSPHKTKGIGWPWCRLCGLLYLNNDVTAEAIKLGCNWRLRLALLLLCLSAPAWAASTPRDRGKDLRGPVKTQPVKPPPRQGRGWCAEVPRG